MPGHVVNNLSTRQNHPEYALMGYFGVQGIVSGHIEAALHFPRLSLVRILFWLPCDPEKAEIQCFYLGKIESAEIFLSFETTILDRNFTNGHLLHQSAVQFLDHLN